MGQKGFFLFCPNEVGTGESPGEHLLWTSFILASDTDIILAGDIN